MAQYCMESPVSVLVMDIWYIPGCSTNSNTLRILINTPSNRSIMSSKYKKRMARKRRQINPMADEVAGWITPDLDVHPVGEIGEHYDWLLTHFKLPKNAGKMDQVYRMGFAHGYVRYRSNAGYLNVEGKKENVQKTEDVWRQFAKNRKLYITYVDYLGYTSMKESQALGHEGEGGGWITKNKKVHPVNPYSHYKWVADNYEDIKDLRAEPIEDTINKLKVFNNKDLLRLFND